MSTTAVKTAISNAIVLASLALMTVVSAPAQVCGPDPDGRVANAVYRDTTIVWEPLVEYDRLILTIGGPCEDIVRVFGRGEPIFFDIRDIKRVQDGAYTWELRRVPTIDPATQKALAKARALGDDSIWWDLWQSGAIPQGPYIDSASFFVANGVIVPPGLQEGKSGLAAKTAAGTTELRPQASPARLSSPFPSAAAKGSSLTPITAADQVIPDDLIVQGSLCVGFDCVNGESFSFDTIRLKENNLRIKFDDTSTLSGFPSNDWQLTANDSASGGASKFSIEDVTGAKVPFTVRAGAPSNSIFVSNAGRVGFRTSTPVLDLHVNTSNTPGLRLEQNSSGGFAAQTWDIAGNETNFFIRDVTGGSRLPFRIRPGAPTSSIDISADGDIGIGTASPNSASAVHISRSTGGIFEGVRAENNNEVRYVLKNTGLAEAPEYVMAVNNTSPGIFFISRTGGGGTIVEVAQRNDANGVASLKVTGSVQATNVVFSSSRSLKQDFAPLDPQEVLAKVASLPITRWKFKEGPANVEHIGPMAEDFHTAFGLNPDAKTISITDSSGVALAAIQGLLQQVTDLQRENAKLAERLAAMERLLQQQQ